MLINITSTELQLAMALLPSWILFGLLGFCLLGLLLRHTTPHHRLRKHCAFFFLRRPRLCRLRPLDGYRRIPHSVCVCEEDLRCYQSRLMGCGFVLGRFWNGIGDNST
jgi:hypothetical protein